MGPYCAGAVGLGGVKAVVEFRTALLSVKAAVEIVQLVSQAGVVHEVCVGGGRALCACSWTSF